MTESTPPIAVLAGGSGFIGTALAEALRADGSGSCAGYSFQHPDLDSALRKVIHGSAAVRESA